MLFSLVTVNKGMVCLSGEHRVTSIASVVQSDGGEHRYGMSVGEHLVTSIASVVHSGGSEHSYGMSVG